VTICGGGWCSNDVNGSHRVGLWKNIRKGCVAFFIYTRFEVVDGSRIRFLYDVRCEDQAFKVVFLKLFSIAVFKDVS
jgi:hypothetical protein